MKKFLSLILVVLIVASMTAMSISATETSACVAKVNDTECADATALGSALNSASGDVTVEVYDKITTGGISLNNADITKLSFVGMDADAEICVNGVAYIDVRSTSYPIEYTNLILSHTNGSYGNDGRLQEYFSTYSAGNVTYTNCTFPNGVTALGSTNGTTVTFNNCTFNNTTSGKYSLWVDGNGTNVVVNGGTFCGVRGVKLFAENGAAFSTLEVTNATFANTINEKAAVVLTRGESVALTANTFNNTTDKVHVDGGEYVSEIDGKTVTIDGTEYTVDSESAALEEAAPAEPTSGLTNCYTSETGYWGECGGNASESFVFKFYNGDTYMGSTSLNDVGNIINGDVYVSWSIMLDAGSNTDPYWTMEWTVQPTIDMQPTRVEHWVDGVKAAEAVVEPNWSDKIFKVVAAVADEDGKILSYVNNKDGNTFADAVVAAESGSIIYLYAGEYELPAFSGKELTFKGADKDGVIVNDAPDARTQGWVGSTIHFENLTAKGATANYHGLANSVVAVTYKNCNINGLRFLYADTVSFEDCAFDADGVEHSFWTYGSPNVTVTDCTFTYTDRAVNCYSENGADHELDISFSGCTFNYNGTAESPEGAVEINSGSVKSIDLTMDDCTAPDDGAMWFNSQWDSTGGVNTKVVVDNTKVWPYVAQVGETKYTTLADAAAAAVLGDEIIVLADVTEDVTVPAGVIFNGNGKQVGAITADGEITFKGHTKATNFSVNDTNTTINIGEGACLEITDTGRLVIGHGCTFNITGTIADAKTANTEELTPSLIMPGASFTGAGVTFNATNAYIKTTASYCSSSKSASGTFDFNIENCIWEQYNKLAFEAQSTAATVNFELKDSVLTTTSHLVFGVSAGEIVIDNSNVNVGTSRQIENRSTMTIKNGSVVNGAVATSSNAINPGTLILENATYSVTGEFSGTTVGTGTIVIKDGASFTAGKITNANIQIDAANMSVGDEINLTADLSGLTGTVTVINNNLEAKIVDGKIVLDVKPVAQIGETYYTSLAEAFDAAVASDTVTILAGDYTTNITVNKAITVVGETDAEGNNLVNITGKLNITADGATVKNLNVNNGSSSAGYINAKDVLVEGCTVVGGNGFRNCYTTGTVTFKNSTITGSTYGIHFDGSAGGNIVIDNCVITGWTSFARTIKKVAMTNTKFEEGNYNYVRFYQEEAIIDGCTFNEKMAVDLAVDDATLTVSNSTLVNGNVEDLFEGEDMVNSDITVDGNKLVRVAQIGDTYYATLAEAFDAAKGETNIVIDLVDDATLDITAWQTLAIGGDVTETITINGNGNTLTFNKLNSDWNHVTTNNDAKLILNDMTITDSGYNNGPWNRYDLNFACDVELNNVTATKALAFKADAVLNTVTINETGDNYAIWIQPNGQNVAIDGLTVSSAGRGIKIDEQYVSAPAKVELTVENATFTTEKKAAILVKSAAGADIALTNVDISGVKADTVNAVWNDSDSGASFSEITVTGGTLGQESADDFAITVSSNGAIVGYYNDLQAALNAAAAGTGNVTVEILDDIDLTNVDWNPVTVSAPGYPVVTVNGNEKTITGLNDMLFAGTWAGGSGLIINDLTIANSTIVNDENDTKGTVGVGAFIGYPQASATITLNNCHLVNSTVKGGHWTGGLIGMAGGYNGNDGPVFMNLTITGCSVTGSTITGKGSVGGVIGHGSCAAWTNVVIENTTVSGNTISSTGSSNVKAGAVMGTIGAAGQSTTAAGETKTGGASVAATVSDNTVTSNGTTITTIYGRQGTTTGMLYVTGGNYDNYPIEENVAYAAPVEGYEIVENENGTYGLAEKVTPEGDIGRIYIDDNYYNSGKSAIFGEVKITGTESMIVKLYSGETLVGTAALVDTEKVLLCGKSKSVSWHIRVNEVDNDSWWDTEWVETLTVNNIPDKAELWVDGVKVDEGNVELNNADSSRPVCAAVTDANGNIQSFIAGTGWTYTDANYDAALQTALNAGGNIVMLRDVTLTATLSITENITLNLNGKTITTAATAAGNFVDAFTILADVTVTGEGTVDARPSNGYTFYIGDKEGNAGNLTIENGTFYGVTSIVNNRLGTVTINGGTFEISLYEDLDYRFTLNCIDASVKNGTAKIVVKGGTFYNFNPADNAAENPQVNFVADGYAALPDLNGNYVVGEKPTATVNNLGSATIAAGGYTVYPSGNNTADMPLSFVMQFLADQDAEDMANSPFAEWYGDFVITFTGIENGSFTANGCYLAGHYGDFGWIKVPVDGLTIEEGVRYPVMLGVGLGQKYDYICSGVQDFKCALYLTPEILEANPNLKVNLELAVVDNSNGEDAAASALINNENVFSVTDYTYEAEDFVTKFNFHGNNITLQSSLAMTFYVDPENLEEGETYTAKIVQDRTGLKDKTAEIASTEWVDQYGLKGIVYSGIAAKEMTDPISIQIFNSKGVAVSECWTTSVEEYALGTFENNSDEAELKTALVDMLNYGAAAQTYFGYNTTDLTNAEFKEEHLGCASTTTSNWQDTTVFDSDYFYGNTLYLEDTIALALYFHNIGSATHASISYTDHYGNPVSYNVNFTDYSNLKEVKIDTLAIADATTVVKCELKDDADNVITTVKDSIASCVAYALTTDKVKANANLVAAYESINKFATSAYAYFH